MKTNEKKNTSVKKKLIPAVAMLTTSAVMLSTATYAWFTLNKEVEVTGLQMSATASDALEISLGEVAKGTNAIGADLAKQPADTDAEISWTKRIDISEYYSTVDLLMPASTVNGKDFFDATDATNAGKSASTFVAAKKKAEIDKRDAKTTKSNLATDKDNSGYYVDIPVHLRTSKYSAATENNNIYCKMKITDPTVAGTVDGELYKAVRVAFIPTGDEATAASIWCENDQNYETGKAVSSTTEKTAITADLVKSGEALTSGKTTLGITIPSSTEAGEYGHVDFTVRVWLEGESTFCHDANAAQDWNIDFAFALDNTSQDFVNFGKTTTDQGGN